MNLTPLRSCQFLLQRGVIVVAGTLLANCWSITVATEPATTLKVGASAVDLSADDSMVIGGGIQPGFAHGQEGNLRAVATVLQVGSTKIAIVACDVLMMNRDLLDPVLEEIQRECAIPTSHCLVNATHTHHAPSTCTVHGYSRDETFCRTVQQGIVQAVQEADDRLEDADFLFALGDEATVGQNSRLRLGDNSIFWIGSRDDAVRPTGPFDSELPVLSFRGKGQKPIATWFNHSTHSIGTRGGAVRSPAFYGLAAQGLEEKGGGVVGFLEGASGSTHNLALSCDECVIRIEGAVRAALAVAEPHEVSSLAAIKREIPYRVRAFDEAVEHNKVVDYCTKRVPGHANEIIGVFKKQREILAPQQGNERRTWIQALRIGDVAIVGIPAEYFTQLGMDIKRRSPFRYTYVAELANDWIGYLPDQQGLLDGGYQTWMGLHSFAEPGTGEAFANEAVSILRELNGRP
jgi:neutral ceramidase